MNKDEQIEEMTKVIEQAKHDMWVGECPTYSEHSKTIAKYLYNAGYRKQNDEELIDKIATYFEKEDNWTKLKYAWNISGKSVQLRDMLRDAITESKMKGGE